MGILTEDIMQDTPAMELYLLLMAFDQDVTNGQVWELIQQWCKRYCKRNERRVNWVNQSYIGIGNLPGPGYRSSGPKYRVVIASRLPTKDGKTTYWGRYKYQMNTTRGWKQQWVDQNNPVISSALYKVNLSELYIMPNEIFFELYNIMTNSNGTTC